MSELITVITPPPAVATVVQPPAPIGTQLAIGQGPAGPAGPQGPVGGNLTGIAATTLNGHRAVAWSVDGQLVHADASNAAHVFALAGLIESAAASGESIAVRTAGLVSHAGWAWADGPVWFSADGQLTQTMPAGYPRAIGRGAGQHLNIDIQPPVAVL